MTEKESTSFIFTTKTVMKAYNQSKYWIDTNIVSQKEVCAKNVSDALQIYKDMLVEEYIYISDNALKNKSPMYIDKENGESKQIGYVITAKTDIDDSQQYVDLWVTIVQIIDVDFEAA